MEWNSLFLKKIQFTAIWISTLKYKLICHFTSYLFIIIWWMIKINDWNLLVQSCLASWFILVQFWILLFAHLLSYHLGTWDSTIWSKCWWMARSGFAWCYAGTIDVLTNLFPTFIIMQLLRVMGNSAGTGGGSRNGTFFRAILLVRRGKVLFIIWKMFSYKCLFRYLLT